MSPRDADHSNLWRKCEIDEIDSYSLTDRRKRDRVCHERTWFSSYLF